jgi:hypothetical protein
MLSRRNDQICDGLSSLLLAIERGCCLVRNRCRERVRAIGGKYLVCPARRLPERSRPIDALSRETDDRKQLRLLVSLSGSGALAGWCGGVVPWRISCLKHERYFWCELTYHYYTPAQHQVRKHGRVGVGSRHQKNTHKKITPYLVSNLSVSSL